MYLDRAWNADYNNVESNCKVAVMHEFRPANICRVLFQSIYLLVASVGGQTGRQSSVGSSRVCFICSGC